MDNKMILKAFNEVNLEMVKFALTLMPDNIDLATMQNALNALITTNPELNLTTFRECTLKRYRAQIEAKDITFFVERKYDDNFPDLGISKMVFEKLDCLRMPVSQLSNENQHVIFDYMGKMTKLCDMYTK